IESFEELTQDDLKNLSVKILKIDDSIISFLLNKTEEGIMILAMEGEKPSKESKLNIGTFVNECVGNFGGRGGGKKDYGQGFISDTSLNISDVKAYITDKLQI
ncbi:MAG: DHHA1 domain-containing protein, partial [Promethearchaeota archaeon]